VENEKPVPIHRCVKCSQPVLSVSPDGNLKIPGSNNEISVRVDAGIHVSGSCSSCRRHFHALIPIGPIGPVGPISPAAV
jgi:hypothetical protein